MNARRWRRALLGTCALVLCRAPVARAQDAPPTKMETTKSEAPGRLALEWRAPPTCPSSADVEARFTHLVGKLTKQLEATASVEATAAGQWNLDLSTVLEGTAGHRVLSGDSCAAVAEAAALILALMIDPAAAERAAAPAPPPPAPPPAAAPPPAVVAAPPPPSSALRPYARAFAGFLFDALPATTAAVGAGGGATLGRYAAELSFLVSRDARATAAMASTAAGTFGLIAVGARGCARVGGPSLFGQACLGGELERITGQGSGVDTVSSTAVLLGAGTAGLTLLLPVASHVSLSLDLTGAARPYRPTFFLGGVGDLWRVPALCAGAGLGVLVII